MNVKVKSNLSRAIRLATAQATDPQVRASVEHDVALDVVGPGVLARDAEVRQMSFLEHRDMTAFEATEEFGKLLSMELRTFAVKVGTKPPKAAKYDLRFATPVMFKGVWLARQVADELGIPYGYFVGEALRYWSEQGRKRVPRVTQLCAPDVLGHVIACWATDCKTSIA